MIDFQKFQDGVKFFEKHLPVVITIVLLIFGPAVTFLAFWGVSLKERAQDVAVREARVDVLENSGIQKVYWEQESELNSLVFQYIEKFGGVDLSRRCGNNEAHNEKVRQAEIMLNFIEAKAVQYEREDYVKSFAPNTNIGWLWLSECKL